MYREPLGVVAAICPFNFPAMIPLWSIPLTIVTGNTLVLKPSERDPGAAMILADLARQAGAPPGVVNIVHGSAPTVDFILDDPRIKAISFVGSDKAGKYIHQRVLPMANVFRLTSVQRITQSFFQMLTRMPRSTPLLVLLLAPLASDAWLFPPWSPSVRPRAGSKKS